MRREKFRSACAPFFESRVGRDVARCVEPTALAEDRRDIGGGEKLGDGVASDGESNGMRGDSIAGANEMDRTWQSKHRIAEASFGYKGRQQAAALHGAHRVDQCRRRVATACAAMASPRPTASTPSFVLALRLISAAVMPRDFASAARIAGKCGPSLGRSQTTTASQ